MRMMVALLAIVLNVLVAFLTDGVWKTAGYGLLQAFWSRELSREATTIVHQVNEEMLPDYARRLAA